MKENLNSLVHFKLNLSLKGRMSYVRNSFLYLFNRENFQNLKTLNLGTVNLLTSDLEKLRKYLLENGLPGIEKVNLRNSGSH